ncbi:uncharacterized protein MYCFIDRAFT_208541 [Pseudocercospora fijiensis CIRAD86]|uniref:Uncharacterized protein n=1 Tax=Pseudocercospora fijiensis (strain CIRAD86) TaxID=383855 RepID=M3A6R2_PSEFD|nr:uncharacterized protein MYCFIDRAFT_208541 [Pseudocercospora fijiensis CIRAD86]EME80286.1 hypothetical protein MYCFIDRAFT_208541 [Pseudocercospora fijiensis CIRAD86]
MLTAPLFPSRQDAAEQHATNARAAETMQDLKDQCAASHASGASSGPASTGATKGLSPAPLGGSSSGPGDSLASNLLRATNALDCANPLGGGSGGGDISYLKALATRKH